MDYLEPFTFNGVRSLIGGAALLPCIWILQKLNGRSKDTGTKKDLLTGGLACGVLLFAASSLLLIGIKYTPAGKAGFITAFYIVIVPVMGVFLHKKIGWKIWLAVVLAVAGLYFLCITESFSVGKGDILVFLCALVLNESYFSGGWNLEDISQLGYIVPIGEQKYQTTVYLSNTHEWESFEIEIYSDLQWNKDKGMLLQEGSLSGDTDGIELSGSNGITSGDGFVPGYYRLTFDASQGVGKETLHIERLSD